MDNQIIQNTPCYYAHTINNVIPNFEDCEGAKKYEGSICDCGKFKVVVEYCGCPSCPNQTKFIEND